MKYIAPPKKRPRNVTRSKVRNAEDWMNELLLGTEWDRKITLRERRLLEEAAAILAVIRKRL